MRDEFGQVVAAKREGPILSYTKKARDLEGLVQQVAAWRVENPQAIIGITSGAFDLVHPGHSSFFNDAKANCDHLIVIVASDRTIRELKGEEKPYVHELKRTGEVASDESVDAVIISDEFAHETILQAIHANILFKGDDYFGTKVHGSEYVDLVMLIPCAEKEFYSSSAFVRKIKEGDPDVAPDWAPPAPPR